MSTLVDRIDSAVASSPTRASVSVIQLATGWTITSGTPDPIRSASTNKIIALLEVFRRVQEGTLDLSQVIHVTVDDYPSGGSDMYTDGLLPGDFTVLDLTERMIIASDNTATNVIMTLVGRDTLRTLLESLDIDPAMVALNAYTGSDPGVRWSQAGPGWEYTMEGWDRMSSTTSTDLTRLLQIIWGGTVVDGGPRDAALGIMARTRDQSRLRSGMPNGLPIAHKAGSLTGPNGSMPATWSGFRLAPGISNDAGIVLLPGLEYAVAVMTEGETNTDGSGLIRAVSSLVLDGLVGGTAAPMVTAVYTDHGRVRLT